ncbi:WD40-repeat-containing domain protein [Crucibulum laeve]|uniref:WD40-repeat-containing domain protein n=1 Tax=Crucibulum laeve TaxID=68775 RepID=A0A5C3LWB1_9AGAR|nr:WD40-repeat-containing domain protein [Crucibulum laeve]
MCTLFGFDDWEREDAQEEASRWRIRKGKQKESPRNKLVKGLMQEEDDEPLEEMEQFAMLQMDPALEYLTEKRRKQRQLGGHPQSPIARCYPRPRYRGGDTTSLYRQHFRDSYITMANWRQGGSMLRIHRHPVITSDSGVVTSLALDSDWIVVGLASSNIHVFSARTGVLARTLVGHDLGVWCVALVSKGGWMDRKSGGEKSVNGDGTRRNSTGNATDAEPSSSSSTIPPPDDGDDGEWTRRGAGIAAHTQQRRRRSMRSLHTDFRGMDISGSVSVTNTARMPIPSAEGLDRHLPPALRTALGLDGEGEGEGSDSGDDNGRRSGVFSEDAALGNNEDEDATPDAGKRSDANFTSQGWGQPNALVVSGGCDKMVRVWDIKSGRCIYVLAGHTSTTRCIRVLHNRPVAVSGSRDGTLRVWDIQRGSCLRVLRGHQDSVRCLDVCGNIVVSGSYDTTCRVWNADTGACVHVLTGHFHQIYSVAFDGVRIASGGLDTTVRLWDVKTGECLAILNGHTALVCQLQLSSTILATGGSDGRVITFSLESPYDIRHRIAAHDSSVTSLQFDKNFLVTGGNDGRVRLYEIETAAYIRDLSEPSESVWKVGYSKDICAVMCRRAGKTVMEIWSMRPRDDQ